jgi:hypothetical protein
MNLSAGLGALGQGLNLIADRQSRREERDWAAMREENFMRLRHQQGMELEEKRSANEAASSAEQRKFVGEQNKLGREADDNRQDRADRRADARLNRQLGDQDKRELIQLRRDRPNMIMRFREQIRGAESDLSEAQSSGADDARIRMLTDRVNEARAEASSYDAEAIDRMAALGDQWALNQLGGFSELDVSGLASNANGIPVGVETGPGAAQRKPKPMQGSATTTKPVDMVQIARGSAVPESLAAEQPSTPKLYGPGRSSDTARAYEEQERQRQARDAQLTSFRYRQGSETRGRGASAPRLIP